MSASTTRFPSVPRLPATLRLGAVELIVGDLERSITFYQDALGLRLRHRDSLCARLGVDDEDLVVLHEDRQGRPAGRHAGLYHFALLFASREELAHAALRLAATGIPIDGASDHGVSEAIYLSDPDGNGIELYADRPREQWPAPSGADQRVGMYTMALDMRSLLAVADGQEPRRHAAAGLTVGHVHLHVGDVQRSLAFYRDLLGFEVMALLPSAAFVAAGGYHHHLGFNTWRGQDVSFAPPHSVGLHHWTVLLDTADQVAALRVRVSEAGHDATGHGGGFSVRDPSGNVVLIRPA